MDELLGVIISKEAYEEYMKLKKKNTPMFKLYRFGNKHCPVCDYVVDNAVPTQKYCDRCGQRFKVKEINQ